MAKIRRIIRKLENPHEAALDEQAWPVNVALVVLGGFSLGASLAYLPLDAANWANNWYANAWTYVVLIPLIVGGSMLAFRLINSKIFRRSMQLALVASAIAHVLMIVLSVQAVALTSFGLKRKPDPLPTDRRVAENAIQLNPDLLKPQDDSPRDFEKPVQTDTPDVTPDQEVKKESEDQSPRTPQPVPVPDPQRTQEPAVVKRPTTEQAAPREAETASKLSRNTKVSDVGPAASKVALERSDVAPKAEEKIAATGAAVSRQATEAKPAERKADNEPTSARPSDTVVMTKKTPETAEKPDTTASSTLVRAVNQPKLTPKSQLNVADAPSIAKRTNETEPIPNNTAATRKTTAGPSTEKASLESTTLQTTVSPTPTTKAELESKPQPNVAASPTSISRNQPRLTDRPAVAVDAPQTAENKGTEPTTPGPRATSVARAQSASVAEKATSGEPASAPNSAEAAKPAARLTRTEGASSPSPAAVASSNIPAARASKPSAPTVVANAANVEAGAAASPSQNLTASAASNLASRQNSASNPSATSVQPSAEAPTLGVGTPVASGGMARASDSASPSINPSAVASNTPQRTSRNSAVSASPASIEAPAAAIGAKGSADPTAEPSRMALTRSQSGTAGAGNSPNLDRGSAAGDSPALVASVSARRTQATSAGPPDAALSPSTPAIRAQGRASAATPSSTIPAESIANATEGGASKAGDLASSSASLNRATGSAAAGEVSAAKGTAEIDVGATTIVSESGRARAAGGGHPEVSSDPQSGKVARQTSGAPQASISADKVAALPEAPAATGGGQPASLDPSNTLAVRGNAASGTAGGPSKAEEKGPLAEASTGVSQTPGSRAETANSGTPKSTGDEKAAGVARAANQGQPAVGATAAQVADVPATTPGEGGGALAAGETAPANTATARTASTGGAAANGALPAAGDNAPAANVNVGTAVAKAEMAAGSPAPNTTAGGGTAAPAKAAGGQQLATAAEAETLQLAGNSNSGGGPEGVALQAQGVEAAKTSGGATSQIVEGAIGAAAGKEVVDAFGPQGAGTAAGGSRTVSPATEDGPSVSDIAVGGGPGKRAGETSVAGDTGQVDIPSVGETSAVAQADLDHGLPSGVRRTASDAGEGLNVNVEAPEGIGGLGQVAAADVGINSRLARSDSLEIAPQPSRFKGRKSGGIPGISTASVVPTDSFKKRAEGRSGKGSLPPQTEAAVELGLAYLAKHQQADGSWRLQGHETSPRADPQMVSDTAATALAVLAFQGAGYNHREHKYEAVVRNGLDYLVQNQKEDGDLFVPLDDKSNSSVWLYSHALASLALCEAYGMTQDPALKEPAQRSLDFIVTGQHKDRGGWRYAPGVGSDTSVTGAMLVALWCGEQAGLQVPKTAYDGVKKWLDQAQAAPSQAHLYRYNPHAPDTAAQRQGRVASPTITALGLLMRMYTGWKLDDPNMIKGADYLKERLPALGTNAAPQRDTYYWYYATQVMWHMKGDYWKQWHEKLHRVLVDTQLRDGPFAGSWNPRLPVADRWGPHGGRLYVTALNLLSLEVPYRHLKTYQEVGK
jgi:hypothetical protein